LSFAAAKIKLILILKFKKKNKPKTQNKTKQNSFLCYLQPMQQAKNVALVYSFVCGKCQQRRIKTHFIASNLGLIYNVFTELQIHSYAMMLHWQIPQNYLKLWWHLQIQDRGICLRFP
jgi:hypothetical protein